MRRAMTLLLAVVTLLVLAGTGVAQERRNKRQLGVMPNRAPTASLAPSVTTITLPCPSDRASRSGACPANSSSSISLKTTANDPDADPLVFTYTVSGGRINGEGPNVNWDLSGAGPGTYTAAVEVDDGLGGITTATTAIAIVNCPDCDPICLLCPSFAASCPDEVDPGQPITFTVSGVDGAVPPVTGYKWTVSVGTITSGQGTSSITVSTAGLGGQNVTATVEVLGLDPSCPRSASCSTSIKPRLIEGGHFDEYGNIRFEDEKARLDNFAIQLQNEPTATGYIIGYGSCRSEGVTRANRARNYLIKTRGLDAHRVVVIDGGCLRELMVTLRIVPQGATPPSGDTVGVISPCPECKQTPARRAGTGPGSKR